MNSLRDLLGEVPLAVGGGVGRLKPEEQTHLSAASQVPQQEPLHLSPRNHPLGLAASHCTLGLLVYTLSEKAQNMLC